MFREFPQACAWSDAHARSSEQSQEACTDILLRWITEMVVGERSNRLVAG